MTLRNAGCGIFRMCQIEKRKTNKQGPFTECRHYFCWLGLIIVLLVNINATEATIKHSMSHQNTWGNELQISPRVAQPAKSTNNEPTRPTWDKHASEDAVNVYGVWSTLLQASHYDIDLLNWCQTVQDPYEDLFRSAHAPCLLTSDTLQTVRVKVTSILAATLFSRLLWLL